jgi:glucose-6-phosphate dehydrogenase assembly protein OpcA
VFSAETEAFLSGQGIPVPLESIETELTRLWGPSAEGVVGSAPDQPTVTRLSLANLVVACLGPESERVKKALDTVLARHPCRAIVMRSSSDPARRVSAEVAAQCTMPAPGVPQVCSEQIILNAGASAVDLLPGAVRPLLESDMPMVLWWGGDPRPNWALFRSLADEATLLIPDFDDPASDPEVVRLALDPARCGSPSSRDIAWFGVTRWRELVAQFFDGTEGQETLGRIKKVEVSVAAPTTDRPARAGAWLLAWLAGQLGWKPAARTARGGRLEAQFQGRHGPIAASVDSTLDASLPSAQVRDVHLTAAPNPSSLDDGEERFRVTRIVGTPEVRLGICSAVRCALPRLVHATEWEDARRMAAALESRRLNPPYLSALPHLMWLMGC